MAATRTRNFRLDDDHPNDFAYRLGLAVLAVMAMAAVLVPAMATMPVDATDTGAFAVIAISS